MRRGVLWGSVLGLLNAAIALTAAWWWRRTPTEFGWVSYSPMPRRYSDAAFFGSDLPSRHHWGALVVLVVAFLLVNALVVGALLRSRQLHSPDVD